jgi:hypothetical protein
MARKAAEDTGPGYTGDVVAAPDAASMDMFRKFMGGGTGMMDAGAGMTSTGIANAAAGTSGAMGAAGGLFAMGGADPTDAHLANAAKYGDNPHISGMVDAAMLDARRNHMESVVPGIDRNAAMTGNMNSTRGGIAQGIAERGLAEKAAGLSAQMRGDAFNNGLQMSGADANRRMSALTGAGGIYGDMAKNGLYGAGLGAEMQATGANIGGAGAAGVQAGNQAILDNGMGKDMYQLERQWSPIKDYAGIAQAGNWGGTTREQGVKKDNPSTLSKIGSGVSIMGSLFKLCDARFKTVIQRTGETRDGLPLYLIAYTGLPHLGLHITPLAQDVLRHRPEAVTEINGALVIDTSKYDWR